MKVKLYILRVLEKRSYIYCLINPPIVILNNTHAMRSKLSYAVTHLGVWIPDYANEDVPHA